jgi:hypothetical protein
MKEKQYINNKKAGKTRRLSEGDVYVFDILVVIALLLSISAMSYAFLSPVAHQGVQGIQGMQGLQGLSPEYNWSSTQLQFMNPNGSWGAFVDLKGDKGNQGVQGIQGIQGIQGMPGINGTSEVNHKPIITIPVMQGYYNETSLANYTFIFNLITSVNDSDNDTVQTIVYYRFSITSVWIPAYIFFDTNQTVTTSVKTYTTIPVDTMIHWAIMAWDGRDISIKYYAYLLFYP